jgi:hypothetical protein
VVAAPRRASVQHGKESRGLARDCPTGGGEHDALAFAARFRGFDHYEAELLESFSRFPRGRGRGPNEVSKLVRSQAAGVVESGKNGQDAPQPPLVLHESGSASAPCGV